MANGRPKGLHHLRRSRREALHDFWRRPDGLHYFCLARPRCDEHNGQDHSYGGPVQTWCDINPDCNGWSKGLHRASPDQKHSPSHKHGHEASNR